MGAQLWYHEAPWYAKPADALQELQARFLAENYDLAKLLPQHLGWERESIAACREDGDPYDLLEMMEQKLALLEDLCSKPIPNKPAEQIKILQQLNADSGEGIGNVLDLTGVSKKRQMHTATPLSDKELVELVGSTQPDLPQAQKSIYKINGVLERGDCVCFAFYAEGQPAGWYFVGNTID
ncbi:hypothetical protein [Anatilimnocola floriformis]|uniref:hypothetical protein n=1 Tax=Anatilimnocola floriformis TaxID=2948575 RepID=UPI0020C29C64|nr:hypothetical protein [Anatilimnocola floriformis]